MNEGRGRHASESLPGVNEVTPAKSVLGYGKCRQGKAPGVSTRRYLFYPG